MPSPSGRKPGSGAACLRTCEDHAELHAALPVVRAPTVARLAPPPEAIAEAAGQELHDLDAVPRELDVQRFEADAAGAVDQALGFVPTQMAEPPVVASVRSAEHRRDVAQRVRHRDPRTTASS